MSTVSVILGVATGAAAAAGTEAVRELVGAVRRRGTKREPDDAKKMQISKIAEESASAQSAVEHLLEVLDDTPSAVVIVGNLAVVKSSVGGAQHTIVRQLSEAQRARIDNHDAPVDDSAKFQEWLNDSSLNAS